MSRPLRAVIHTQSLKHNLQRARDCAPNSKVMAVVKADGYGHGIVNVAQALQDADAFAVASIDEAILVQDQVPGCPPICLLEGVFSVDELAEAASRGLQLVVHSLEQVAWLEQASLPGPVTVWLKVDTGMNRLGINPSDFEQTYQRLDRCANVSQLNLMSHFASADDAGSSLTRKQIDLFDSLDKPGEPSCSMANSAAILQWPESHYQWIRPGIMLYGSSPVAGKPYDSLNLLPAMTLESRLVATKNIRKGETVGYGETWKANMNTRIGVVACGYGDGYPRHVNSTTPVLVNGVRAPIVGRVSMDMITVDLGKITDAAAGDPVILWGEGLSVDEIADHAGTISYELLCQVTQRALREVR